MAYENQDRQIGDERQLKQEGYNISLASDVSGIKEHVAVLNTEMGGVQKEVKNINRKLWIMSVFMVILVVVNSATLSSVIGILPSLLKML